MAGIKGTNLAAPVVPFDTTDVHPSHEARYGKGGYRTVATTAERDAIPAARREAGMLVYVTADGGALWQLGSDLEAWTEFSSGGVSSWNDLEDIPADFPPQAHTHTAGDIDSESAAAGYVLTANGEGGATWEEASGGGASSWNELTDKPAALDGGYLAIDDDGFLCVRSLNLSNAVKVQTVSGSYGGFLLYSLELTSAGAFISFPDSTTQTTAWTGTVAAEDVTGLASVATSGSYDDLDNLPTLFDGAYSSLTGTPTLGTAAAAATTDFAAASHTHTQLHDRSHAITSTSDHTATNWRVFYSNGSGQVVELALGSSGQALLSNGASAAPSWGAVASSPTVASPSQLTGDQNDYAGATGDINRISANAARSITGIAAGADGAAILLVNVGSNTITLKHQSTSSTAANRIIVPWANDCVIPADASAALVYDNTTQRWRVI